MKKYALKNWLCLGIFLISFIKKSYFYFNSSIGYIMVFYFRKITNKTVYFILSVKDEMFSNI